MGYRNIICFALRSWSALKKRLSHGMPGSAGHSCLVQGIRLRDPRQLAMLVFAFIGIASAVDWSLGLLLSLGMHRPGRSGIIAESSAEAAYPRKGTGQGNGKRRYDRKGNFTAYNPEPAQTGPNPFIMASGRYIYDKAIACPEKYDFGTKIEIEGLGVYTCEDRLAERFRAQERFDILMFSNKEAQEFGIQQLRFRVVPPAVAL